MFKFVIKIVPWFSLSHKGGSKSIYSCKLLNNNSFNILIDSHYCHFHKTAKKMFNIRYT